MLRERTDEVSRLAMRFALIHPVVIEWCSSDVPVAFASWPVAWIFAYRIKTWHALARLDLQQPVTG